MKLNHGAGLINVNKITSLLKGCPAMADGFLLEQPVAFGEFMRCNNSISGGEETVGISWTCSIS